VTYLVVILLEARADREHLRRKTPAFQWGNLGPPRTTRSVAR